MLLPNGILILIWNKTLNHKMLSLFFIDMINK